MRVICFVSPKQTEYSLFLVSALSRKVYTCRLVPTQNSDLHPIFFEGVSMQIFRSSPRLIRLLVVSSIAMITALLAATAALATTPANFGPNVYVFTPDMVQSDIQAKVDAIAAQQVSNQFGTQRYALLFQPGTYGSSSNPLNFQLGYYT